MLGWPERGPLPAPQPAPAQQSGPAVPVVAVTVDDVTPAVGQVVTVINRSTGAAALHAGDGTPGRLTGGGGSAVVVYFDPGAFELAMASGGRTASVTIDVDGTGRPPSIENQTAPGAAFGANTSLRATVRTADGAVIANRPVQFEIAGQTFEAITDDAGVASSPIVADFGVADFALRIVVAALAGGAGAELVVPFQVTANGVPVAEAGGPYDVLVGDPVILDHTGSFDPDGVPLAALDVDLDGDGAFDDLTGFPFQIPAHAVTTVLLDGDLAVGASTSVEVTFDVAANAVASVTNEAYTWHAGSRTTTSTTRSRTSPTWWMASPTARRSWMAWPT